MPFEVVLPALSAGMEEAVVARWLKAEGDRIEKGEALAEVETDKATMEIEAEVAGRVGQLRVADGARTNVNDVIALILFEGEAAPARTLAVPGPAPSAPGETATPPPAAAAAIPETGRSRRKASPLARRMAADLEVDLSAMEGSGPNGRIVRADVERAAATASERAAPSPRPAETRPVPAGIGEYEAVPISAMRRTVARRLLEAKTTVPHFYLSVDCEIDTLLALRDEANAGREKADRVSINDFGLKAAALALRQVPEANAIWTDEAILRLRAVDISVAVATEEGLITPVVRDADRKSLGVISAEVKELAARAREGKLKPEEYQGGGFSLSNLGMYGVKSFAAIVNPPQSCILAVGATERRAVVRDDGIVPASVMNCTLSVDHRSVDGAVGAQWLARFKAAIEQPLTLLV